MSKLFPIAGALLLLPTVLYANPENVTLDNSSAVSFAVIQPTPIPPTFEENAHELALALYFEGRTDEPIEGRQAIASVIVNRTKLPHFPDTIKGVVAQGANGQTTGRCQFSFRCDEHPEDIELLCRLRPLDMQRHWGDNACQKRFDYYLAFAREYLTSGQDNTNGANMYFAAWMKKKPRWYKELVPSSIVRRGSHIFGRNRRFEPKLALRQ